MLRHNNRAIEVAIELTPEMEKLELNAFRILAFYHHGSDVRPQKDKQSGGLVYGGSTIITVRSLHQGLENYTNRDVYASLFEPKELRELNDKKIPLVQKHMDSKSAEMGQNFYTFKVGIMLPNDNFAFKAVLKDVIKKGFKVSAKEDNFLERELIKQISRVAQLSK
jgi:hypothetical protein